MMRMRISLSVAAATLALAAMTSAAHAKQVKYKGKHPIPKAVEGEFCYIEVPHVHAYEPENGKVLYREHEGYHQFVGDPVAHGYDGPKHTYYGHHPVQIDPSIHVDVDVDPVTEYCYLDGPHFHHYGPPVGINFELKGGAYWYIGKYPQHYHKHKKLYAPINVIYEPIVYARPEVVVEAPAGYIGPIVDVHVDAPAVHVEGPAVRAGVEVHVPVPVIEVGIGLPGVVVDHHHHHHVKHKHYKHRKHRRHGKWKH